MEFRLGVLLIIATLYAVLNGRVQCQNYYKILGVKPTASAGEIKRAFRDLALQHHPDKRKHSTDAETFIQIRKAYEVLGNVKKRQQYDAKLKFQSATFNFDNIFARHKPKTSSSKHEHTDGEPDFFGSDFQFADIFNMIMDTVKQQSFSHQRSEEPNRKNQDTKKDSELVRFIIRNVVKAFAHWNSPEGDSDTYSNPENPNSNQHQSPSLISRLFGVIRACDFSGNRLPIWTCAKGFMNLFA
ncbi:uncharacterized protein LOC129585682 [Paramacrobiotus metropolitanus]|uniref:uncharacterized protein LOC129585682 n=1 Tax=Paramacrobiotus metropolitanus TaxID=2943436 RepID=UPI002445BE28|nr:uncharacterized protein LOC129585682 [Paramacrobiotus metropolitanus]